jgi:hypothetical protein
MNNFMMNVHSNANYIIILSFDGQCEVNDCKIDTVLF